MLEWSPPSDTGGRKDLTYSVICKKCGSDTSQCEICGGGIRFIPRHTGLINSSVTVLDFVSHVNYTFEIEAMNGVSELSFSPKQFTAITVTTDQDGKFFFYCESVTVTVQCIRGGGLWTSLVSVALEVKSNKCYKLLEVNKYLLAHVAWRYLSPLKIVPSGFKHMFKCMFNYPSRMQKLSWNWAYS